MTLHVFKCSNRESRSGCTPDKTGANLPANECQGGRWIYGKKIDFNLGDSGGIGASTGDIILAAIKRDGYYINEHKSSVTEFTQFY